MTRRRPAWAPATAAPQACALWTELLARLWLAQVACCQAQARRELYALGLRRTGTAAVILFRELAAARRVAWEAGAAVGDRELHRRIGELACCAPLAAHLRGLVDVYERIDRELGTALGASHRVWLAARRSVHQAQAQAMAVVDGSVMPSGGDAGPVRRPGKMTAR